MPAHVQIYRFLPRVVAAGDDVVGIVVGEYEAADRGGRGGRGGEVEGSLDFEDCETRGGVEELGEGVWGGFS